MAKYKPVNIKKRFFMEDVIQLGNVFVVFVGSLPEMYCREYNNNSKYNS